MQTIISYAKQFVQYVRNNRAVSALEYAILVGVIAVAAIGFLTTFNTSLTSAITNIGSNISTTTANTGSRPTPTPN